MKKIKKKNEEKIRKNLKKNNFSNALSHHCTDAWVTRPERPKGREGSYQAGPKGRSLEVGAQRAPRLLVIVYFNIS